MKIEENEIYTTKEVAEILKISLPTIKRMLKDGRLPSTRIGRQHRFLGKDLLDIMKSHGMGVTRDEPAQVAAAMSEPGQVRETPMTFAPREEPERVSPELRRRSYMLGKQLRSDLIDDDASVIAPKGAIVTEELIQEAGRRRKLMELFSNLE